MDEMRLGHTCSVITTIADIGVTGFGPTDSYKRRAVEELDVLQDGSSTCLSKVSPNEVFTDTSTCTSSLIATCEVESPKEWPYTPNMISSTESVSLASRYDEPPKQRNRKVTRPYSPEVIVRHKRMVDKKKLSLQYPCQPRKGLPTSNTRINDEPFSCDLCKSPYIINPTRCRLPYTKAKRKPAARKVIDPVMKKVLVVCNACGLASGRNQMNKGKKPGPVKAHPSEEDKSNYRKEAILFAKSLAVSLQEPLLERFYCPAYKCKPCHCLQSYIMGNDKSCNDMLCTERALQLLALLKEAKSLSKQKDLPDHTEHGSMNVEQNKSKVPRGAKLRRTQAFEDFVLSQRLYLRDKLGLCERACQRVLVYSNNFLHKKVKSASNKGSRIENVIGKNVAGALKPISELANTSCCKDNCVILASTHGKLLESWRKTAKLSQRQARRVLAEMLTPTGGTKANCYKFISMVTGCSYTTINLVNEHMKRTQGDREPPEHGLKRWHRELAAGETRGDPQSDSENEDDPCNWSDLDIPSQEELQTMNSQQALAHLQQQQEKLDRIKKQIADQQLLLEKQQTLLNAKTPPSNGGGTENPRQTVGFGIEEGTTVLNSPQLLHILTLPTSTSGTAGVPTPRHVMSSPTISVMTASGNFEPLGNIGNISVSLPDNSSSRTTFSNVVIIPESSLDVSSLGSRVYTDQHTDSLVPVPAASYEVDISSSPSASQSQTTSSSMYQLFAVMDTPSSTIFHFNNY